MTALLYLPTGQSTGQKRPAILMTPGHSAGGKADDAGTAALFALNGFVVLSYDPIGQGERLQYPDPAKPGNTLATRATGEHGEASLQPMLIGETFTKYEIWDAMRGVDHLAQLPEVDGQRIGALGCSGGGAVSAMTSALDTRIAAIGVACFTTSFDTLLPSVGAQEGEQSIPRFVASGFDFPDWIELAAPRPYAVIATYSDMFPFAGARASVIEARRFYSIFDAASAGTPTGSGPAPIPPTPTAPALNADTTNRIAPEARLQFITGPGRHGNLGPIMGEILSFFIRNLEPGTDADHPVLPAAYLEAGSRNPIAGWPERCAASDGDGAGVYQLSAQRHGFLAELETRAGDYSGTPHRAYWRCAGAGCSGDDRRGGQARHLEIQRRIVGGSQRADCFSWAMESHWRAIWPRRPMGASIPQFFFWSPIPSIKTMRLRG